MFDKKEYNKKYNKKYRLEHPALFRTYKKKHYQKHKDEIKKHVLAYHKENLKLVKKRNNEYYQKNKDEISLKNKIYYLKNAEKKRQYSREHRKKEDRNIKNEYFRTYYRKRIKVDPIYKMKGNLRTRLYHYLKDSKMEKRYKFSEYIGCLPSELKTHIEKQFLNGMSWKNHGKWHIDHIIPLSSAKTEKRLYELCHYSNLQPLWAEDNYKKSSKYE